MDSDLSPRRAAILWLCGHAMALTSPQIMLCSCRRFKRSEDSCVIDGELCALDADGRSRFQLLQNALNKKAKLLYM